MSKHIWSDKYQDFIDPELDENVDNKKQEAEKAFEKCKSCAYFDAKNEYCKLCGCEMNVHKICLKLIDGNHCPINIW